MRFSQAHPAMNSPVTRPSAKNVYASVRIKIGTTTPGLAGVNTRLHLLLLFVHLTTPTDSQHHGSRLAE